MEKLSKYCAELRLLQVFTNQAKTAKNKLNNTNYNFVY